MKLKLFNAKDYRKHIEFTAKREQVRRRIDITPTNDTAQRELISAKLAEMDNMPESNLFAVDAKKIHDALDAANGKATRHTYGSSTELMAITKRAERLFDRHGIPQDKRSGCTIVAISGVPESKSYARQSRSAIATRVEFLRGASAWYVTAITRVERYTGPGGSERFTVALTDDARASVIKNALSDFA